MSGRGRGKRVTKVVEPQNEIVQEQAVQAMQAVPIKKVSKKKQFPIVAVITPDGIEGNLMGRTRQPLIVHLPIQSKDVPMNDMPIMYDPHPPMEAQPYDSNVDNPFCEEVEQVESEYVRKSIELSYGSHAPVQQVVPYASHPKVLQQESHASHAQVLPQAAPVVSEPEIDYYTLKSTFLVQFKDSSEVKQLPMQSDAACFWCCHTFTHRPVVLPIRDTGEHLLVTGNFCSPECATSYLFDMRQDSHTRWEQFALLHRVYGEACHGTIYPAPARNSLALFGGLLSIQEYRALIRSHKVRVDIHLPPMVSILATMDTKPIDFYDASLTKNVTETVKERLQKAEEVLRLRRTKPLKAFESTLDACLNLKIKHDVQPASHSFF
jgi:hypothetical protein